MNVAKRQWSFGFLMWFKFWNKRIWISQEQLCPMELFVGYFAHHTRSRALKCDKTQVASELSNVILVRLISLTGGRVESTVAGCCMEHARPLSMLLYLAQWDRSTRGAYHTTAGRHTSHVGRCCLWRFGISHKSASSVLCFTYRRKRTVALT
jgi:hypothetical protein